MYIKIVNAICVLLTSSYDGIEYLDEKLMTLFCLLDVNIILMI